jgi:hypothetical protein
MSRRCCCCSCCNTCDTCNSCCTSSSGACCN